MSYKKYVTNIIKRDCHGCHLGITSNFSVQGTYEGCVAHSEGGVIISGISFEPVLQAVF